MGNQSQINTYFLYSSVVKDRLTFEGIVKYEGISVRPSVTHKRARAGRAPITINLHACARSSS